MLCDLSHGTLFVMDVGMIDYNAVIIVQNSNIFFILLNMINYHFIKVLTHMGTNHLFQFCRSLSDIDEI